MNFNLGPKWYDLSNHSVPNNTWCADNQTVLKTPLIKAHCSCNGLSRPPAYWRRTQMQQTWLIQRPCVSSKAQAKLRRLSWGPWGRSRGTAGGPTGAAPGWNRCSSPASSPPPRTGSCFLPGWSGARRCIASSHPHGYHRQLGLPKQNTYVHINDMI